jgi:HlyD family secretion protein
MTTRMKWSLGAAGIAAVAAVSILGWLRAEDPTPGPAGHEHKEVAVERGRFRLAVSASGLVRPIDRIELKSKASGEVTELPIEVGDRVEKGALIAQLDQLEERAALAQAKADLEIARAELELAEKNFERRKQLFSSDVIAKEARDETELNLAVARSKLVQATTALDRARERMQDSVITAPVDGVILQKYVESGQIIASGVSNVGGGTPIADIADMRNAHIEAGVDEIDIGKISVGQIGTIRADAYPDQVYEGEVVRIAPEARVEQNVTLFDVVVEVQNTDGNLRSGMNATVEIVIVDLPDVLTIPVTAVQESDTDRGGPPGAGGVATVLVKDGSDYVPREVRTGRTNYRVVEVLSGLEEGEVLGIPMVSRLKEEHDRLDARVRGTRSFGGGDRGKRKPTDRRG